ncbi:MAG: 16S rRNA (adenine(1518)-N(6)/adenine(1519)-N(6))-dimethyltransferase RsmA [Chloroflexota bacterium]
MELDREDKLASLLGETRRLMRRAGIYARKRLGQHFLVDSGVLRRTLAAAEIKGSDLVLEIGPGLGVLTQELVKSAGWVVAVELDERLAGVLKEELKSATNLTIVSGDILKITPEVLLNDVSPSLPANVAADSYKVVANLPYYITSFVLRHLLTAKFKPSLMVVMVQKEVARAISAVPGEMSLLAVSVQFYGAPKIVSYVPAQCFFPAPEVDSAILKIDVFAEPKLPPKDEKDFFGLVRAGFCANRKQLANSLAQGLRRPKTEILPLLKKADIAPERRAETLSLEEWLRLYRSYSGEAHD